MSAKVDDWSAAPLTLTDVRRWKAELEEGARAQSSWVTPKATQLLHAAERDGRAEILALAHWVAGNVALLLSQSSQALLHYQHAELLYAKQQDALSVARLCVGKVEALCDLGQHANAIHAGEAALALLQASPDDSDLQRQASLQDALGANYERLGWLVEALAHSERAQQWWHTRPGQPAQVQAARAQTNAAVVKILLGQYIEAQQDLLAARNTLMQAAPESDTVDTDEIDAIDAMFTDVARIDMNLAWLEVARQNAPEVIEQSFAEAHVSRAQIDPDHNSVEFAFFDLLQTEWSLSQAYTALHGQPVEQALLSLAQRCKEAGLVHESTRAEIQLARAVLKRGDTATAQQMCADQLRAAMQRGDVELAHLAGVALAQAQLKAEKINEAVATLEAVIQRAEATRSRFSSDEFRAGYLDDKLAAYQLLAAISLSQSRPARAFAVMEQAKARTLAESLGAIAVQPSSIGSVDATADALAEIAAQLQPDEMLVSYTWVQDQMHAFLISQAGLSAVIKLGAGLSSSQLRNDLARLSAIARLPVAHAEKFVGQHIRSAQVILGRWYEQFFEPLRSAVQRYPKLVICPDQLLGLIPFASLYHAQSGRYLVEDHEVIIAPSSSIWATIQLQEHPARRACLVAGLSSGGRLPHAVAEAQAVATEMAAAGHTVQLLVEAEATLAACLQAMPTQDMIYLASHGTYRPDAPTRSAIEFADGSLTTDHIAKLRLTASVVVLSACETGVGHLSGNELMGFVRAFLYAGAQSVIATHWPVDDTAMQVLMSHFVKHLTAHPGLASAFCASQRSLLRQENQGDGTRRFAHPYYWAALSVVGRG